MSEIETANAHSLESKASTDRVAKTANRFALRLFLAIIALAPLPFGSADDTSTAFWCILLSVALIFCDPAQLGKEKRAIVTGIVFLLGVFVLMVLLQISSPPWLGSPDPLWAEAAKLLDGPVSPSIAVPRLAPIFHLGVVFACVLSLVLGIVIGCDRRMAHQILLVFAWSGAAYALYGIISALVDPGMILWHEREAYLGNVLGTFTYRNTAASYFGVCSTVWFLMLCENIKTRLPRQGMTWKQVPQAIFFEAQMSTFVTFAGFFVCLMALLMTGSRAGTVISLGVLIGAGAVHFRQYFPEKRSWLFIFGAGVGGALLLLQVLGGSVSQRFETSGFSDDSRYTAYVSILRMIADHPWWGTGLGTFSWAFPQYRGTYPSLFGVWEIAHSTPLELAAEMGLPLTLLIGLGWILVFAILIRGVFVRRRDAIIPLAGAAVAAISFLHSWVDFPLQIAGYAIGAMAIIGVGLSQSFRSA